MFTEEIENEDSEREKKTYTNPHFNATRVSAQVGDMAMRGYNNLDISCFITAEWQFSTSRFWWTIRFIFVFGGFLSYYFFLFVLWNWFSLHSISHSLQHAIKRICLFCCCFPTARAQLLGSIEFVNFNQLELQGAFCCVRTV